MAKDIWIEKFRRETLPRIVERFQPRKVILFGSRVSGDAGRDSDLDAVIVAESFLNVPRLKRMPLVMKEAPFVKHVDYLCYTPEEFERIKDQSMILIDALAHGVEVS
jgi:hypothetical protein